MRTRYARATIMLLRLYAAGCGGSTTGPDGGVLTSNRRPVAFAGPDRRAAVGTSVPLDGTASVDPEGHPLLFRWALVSFPDASTASISNPHASTPSLVPDVPGDYAVQLVVSDGQLDSLPVWVNIAARGATVSPTNHPPVARIQPVLPVATGTTVPLDGTASMDPDGDPLLYAWDVAEQPASSAATPNPRNMARSALQTGVAGAYVVTLTVDDGRGGRSVASVSFTAGATTGFDAGFPGTDASTDAGDAAVSTDLALPLGFTMTDAEYSRALDRIVAVGASPNRLYIIDPEAGTAVTADLPLAPVAVSVSPDGLTALVGHDGHLTLWNLTTATRSALADTSVRPDDVVLAPGAIAFVFGGDQWEPIRIVNMTSNVETPTGPDDIYGGTLARLHPDAHKFYTADNGVSPDNIERFNISGASITGHSMSPYWGEHPICGNIWFSDDGARVFTPCGSVFRSSDDPTVDMHYNGSLGTGSDIRYLDHNSTTHRIAAITYSSGGFGTTPTGDDAVHWWEDGFLVAQGSTPLPNFPAGPTHVTSHGARVFFSSSGTRVYVLVHADPSGGALADTGLVRLDTPTM